jgi:hypothetical protein
MLLRALMVLAFVLLPTLAMAEKRVALVVGKQRQRGIGRSRRSCHG